MGDVEKEDRTSESVDFLERSVTDTPPGDVSGHVELMAVDEAKEGVDPASHAHEDQRRVPPPTRGVAEDVGSDATNVMDHPPASVPEQAGRLPAQPAHRPPLPSWRLELVHDLQKQPRWVSLHRTRSTRIPALAHAHPPRRFRSGRSESSSSAWSAVLLNDLFGVLFAY